MSSVSNGDRLRAMYQGGRANTSARRYAKAWSTVFGPGLVPRRWVTLDWWRWIAASMIALILLLVLAVGLFIKLQPSPAPLALPVGVTPPQGPVNGIWSPAKGSVAGFRVQESALGFSNEVVGRTNGVTGTIAISGSRVTARRSVSTWLPSPSAARRSPSSRRASTPHSTRWPPSRSPSQSR